MNIDPQVERTQEALRAARLYYLQDRTMEAIAHEMHVSRSSVSRLLSFARQSGLVQVIIHSPQQAQEQLEERLVARFEIAAHVVPVPPRVSEAEKLERTALSAARILGAKVASHMTIGVAWGATLSAISRHLAAKVTHDSHIVQMNGAANVRTSGIAYASEILDRFGAAFSARVHQFPVPALFDQAETKQAMWRERSVRSVLDIQSAVSLFIFGLGSPRADVPSHVYTGDYFDDRDRAMLVGSGVVGDCATVFYRRDGSSDGIDLNLRSSGPDLDNVRRIPHRFCVVSGASKLSSLQGALAAGVITELVVDEMLARQLLDS